MILSSLEGPPNLSLMTLEVPKVSPSYDPVGLLEELENTPLYDSEQGQWKRFMHKTQDVLDSLAFTGDQFLGMLVTSELFHCSVIDAYKKLKETSFYNTEQRRWNEYSASLTSSFEMNTRFLDILILSKFDRKLAKDSYENLKNTYHYDRNFDQWNCDLSSIRVDEENLRISADQLLGVLVCLEFDLDAAKMSYLNLQSTVLYDKEQHQWNRSMDQEQGLHNSDRLAHDQLLDVLVLSNIDVAEAKNAYERLKQTSLYDSELRQWNCGINADQEVVYSERFAGDQLLAVLIEAKLAKAFPPETLLAENLPPLPNIWRKK